ncbi:MAG: AAA family ATPase, partial [Thermodesulfobacteriota bacterium]
MSEPVSFSPFRLDPESGRLWRDDQPVALRQKNFALLCYLAARPGRLVTKQELLDALWPGTHVTDVVLKVCINELRQALDDDPKQPRFIETVHRRGYRFVAAVRPGERPGPAAATAAGAAATTLVGRAAELAELDRALGEALGGRRQTVFLSGEAGLGKTTLLDAFLSGVTAGAPADGAWTVRGQCIASYGAREPFLPVLDGLARLCRESVEPRVVDRLRALAPEWLLQLGGVLAEDEREALARRAGNAAPERMLRTLGDALDALSRERPVLLVLEDLHWSDHSTIDLLSYVAQRGEGARLLIIGTYRPVEAIVHGQPVRALKQELVLRRRCRDLPLGLLDETAVRAYVAARFPDAARPGELAGWLHAKTDGNPLFLVTVVDELAARGLLAGDDRAAPAAAYERVGVPETLRQMIEQQLERLPAGDQLLLEAASVAGMRFAARTIAAALETDLLDVEERCAAVARVGRFLRALEAEEDADGSVTARFGFTHSLYREHLYSRIGPSRRALLHRRVGEQLERTAGASASELALHFEECREHARALLHLRGVAERALRAGAYREVLAAVDRGLALVERLPRDADTATTSLALHLTRGQALLAANGFAAPEVREAFDHVRALTEQTDDTPQLATALAGLWAYHNLRGHTAEMRAIAARLESLAERAPFPGARSMASTLAGVTSYQTGEPARARRELEHALAAGEQRNPLGFVDFGAPCLSVLALSLLMLGHPDEA